MNVDGYLEQYLKGEIFPQLSTPPYGIIDATRISHTRPVYLYHEGTKHIQIVGKYYKSGFISLEDAWRKAERDYFNLELLREHVGMKDNDYTVIAPLGRNKVLSALLVMEKASGEMLDHYISGAIYENQSKELFFKLSDLARFFARLHRNSDSGRPVPVNLPQWYLDTVLTTLKSSLSGLYNQEMEIKSSALNWWNRNGIWSDHEVLVHGDATPTNFFFHHQKVTGIDLEKMKLADRCWDLGFIAAELKHHYMWRAGDGGKAEPYIGHFLWEYGVAFRDTRIFHSITRRLPLYMALGLLRIARNTWLEEKYRHRLMGEARLCLNCKP